MSDAAVRRAGRKIRSRLPLEQASTVTIDVSSWPAPCDTAGNPIDPASLNPPWTPPEGGLPKRDAGAFLRAMRRTARFDKLQEVCAEVGGTLAAAPIEAQASLWRGLEAACHTALMAVESQGLEPKDAQVRLITPPPSLLLLSASACFWVR